MKHKEHIEPSKQEAPVAPEPQYVYSGEKNYEPPKADPWVSNAKEQK